MFSHLVEIDDKAESDWLASTFLNPGNRIVFSFLFIDKANYLETYLVYPQSYQLDILLRMMNVYQYISNKLP